MITSIVTDNTKFPMCLTPSRLELGPKQYHKHSVGTRPLPTQGSIEDKMKDLQASAKAPWCNSNRIQLAALHVCVICAQELMGSSRMMFCPEDTPGQFLPKHIRKLGSFSKHNRSRDFLRFCKRPLDKGSKLQVLTWGIRCQTATSK